MKFASFLAAVAIIAASSVPSIAQQGPRVSTDADVITQGTIPAPEYPGGVIRLSFGEVSQIYFKHPFKSIRVADPYTVVATPQNDHTITFTGLAPGTSNITLESADGKFTTYSVVTVTRPIHEVKIYTPKPTDKQQAINNNGSGTIVVNSTNNQAATVGEDAEYKSLLCNDVSCRPVAKAQ